jgi:hypothetical protein
VFEQWFDPGLLVLNTSQVPRHLRKPTQIDVGGLDWSARAPAKLYVPALFVRDTVLHEWAAVPYDNAVKLASRRGTRCADPCARQFP